VSLLPPTYLPVVIAYPEAYAIFDPAIPSKLSGLPYPAEPSETVGAPLNLYVDPFVSP